MKEQQLNKILGKAQDICNHSGGRLTSKRKGILELMLLSNVPLSAYEVTDKYNKSTGSSMAAMSVYRILDFLETEQLVHKPVSYSLLRAHEKLRYLVCPLLPEKQTTSHLSSPFQI